MWGGEKWGKVYQGTYIMKVTPRGQIIVPPTEISSRFRLNRRDELFVRPNGDLLFVQGDNESHTIELNVLSN